MKPTIKPFSLLMTVLISLSFFLSFEAIGKENSSKTLAPILQPIERDAIQYGDGPIKVYVFADPRCPHSQDFISMISENSKMRTMYRYYIFLYELKRLNSHEYIGTIYASSSPLQKMLEVMVDKKRIDLKHQFDDKTEEKMEKIERAAEQIGVSKRPYLIIAKDWN